MKRQGVVLAASVFEIYYLNVRLKEEVVMSKNKVITSWSEVPICIDVPYACVILGMSYDGLLRQIRAKKIKAAKVGREYRITKAELRRILNDSEE